MDFYDWWLDRETTHKNKKTSCKDDEKISSWKQCHIVFKIDSLHCSIFQYLDFDSIAECSFVSKEWYNKSHDKASFYYLDLNDIFKIESDYNDDWDDVVIKEICE